jgi:nitrogen regulatory protein P-II 1
MTKVEAVVLRERVEIVIEAVGHGREPGITHEYRGRVFESRFLPKALLTFVVADQLAAAVAESVADAARSGNDNGDGLVWTTQVEHVTHNRTGLPLERVEEAA